MASKKKILNKLKILISQKFDSPQEAFAFFDKNGNGRMSVSELKTLVSEAEVNSWLSGVVAKKLITELDMDKDRQFNWREFRRATKKLMADTADLV